MPVALEGGTSEALPPAAVPGSGNREAYGAVSRDDNMLMVFGTVVDKATNTFFYLTLCSRGFMPRLFSFCGVRAARRRLCAVNTSTGRPA